MQQVIVSLYRNDVLNRIALMEFNDDINITQDLLKKILSDEGLAHAKEVAAGLESSEVPEQHAACIYDKVSIIKADDEPWASMWRENYVAERYTLYQERVADGSGEVGYINRLGMPV